MEDLGIYDSVDFPLPETFYDDYKGRFAAANQDMTIDKTMRLKEDLKVHADYVASGIYNRFTPEQKKIFYDYYENKISKSFDEQRLTGDALLRWKYQRYMKDYLATAHGLDRNIGKILDYVDQAGLGENTIVIYAADQGFYLGEHGWFDKRFMYEESLRTAFVMRYPGVIRPGTIFDQFVLGIDWAPTILVVCHPIGTQRSCLTRPKTLTTLLHAIFSTLQGTQSRRTKPTLQRAKNANAQSTHPG